MKISHLKNKKIKMIDISDKKLTSRIARAECKIKFSKQALNKVINNETSKGEILNIARSSGILGAKKTSSLIPLCHNFPINFVNIDFKVDKKKKIICVISEVKTNYSTGVEMEALTACSIASLVIYDMCKSLDKKIIIDDLKLTFKDGGKSGTFKR